MSPMRLLPLTRSISVPKPNVNYRTDTHPILEPRCSMTANVQILHAEQVDNGLFIEFDDGQAAHFPATFLRSYLPWFQIDPVGGVRNEVVDVH